MKVRNRGQSYKGSKIVNYDSRVAPVANLINKIYESRVVNYDRRGFIRLATDLKIPHIMTLDS